MTLLFYQLVQINAVAAGVSSHVVFKRVEPRVLPFLGMVSAIYAAVFSYVYSDTGRLSYSSLVSTVTVNAFILGLSASIAVYRLSPWHPLSRYPGPTLGKLSKWYMSLWVAKGNRHLKIQELHHIYGPWIRIGPNELSVDDPAAIRPVYSQMFRAPFYNGAPADADALLTTIDKDEHAQRLVAWTEAFSMENIKHFRTSAQARTSQLLEILSNKKETISMSHWISLWAVDVMGDMSFSGGFETMAAGKDPEGWMEVLHMGVLFIGVLGQVPWMRGILALTPVPGPILAFQKFAGKKNILSIIVTLMGTSQQNDTEGGIELSRLQAHADASMIVLAGSDTVSEAMTALMRYLCADTEDMDAFTLSKLPCLDACVQEALRLVPPVAAGPPRWNKDADTQILDQLIPAGTTVASPNYSMFRDPRNFVDPDKFIPERWLEGGIAGPHNMKAFVPFSYGPGVCIGKPVALYNMKLLTASLVRAFELAVPEDFDVKKFDRSYKEHGLWVHDDLYMHLRAL
ncbi:cytochrome P450 [Lyophyllum atratum]|nr:cytochrome P450 [Lyophyllum atratum]